MHCIKFTIFKIMCSVIVVNCVSTNTSICCELQTATYYYGITNLLSLRDFSSLRGNYRNHVMIHVILCLFTVKNEYMVVYYLCFFADDLCLL